MKKTIALLLALVMLLALAACHTSENTPSTNDSGNTVPSSSTPATSTPASSTPASSAPVTSTPASSAPVSSTPASSTPTTSAPATSTPASTPSSQPTHTHTYSSSVTSAATCDKPGVKTFTCSCGDTYTEENDALGHFYGDWQIETHAFIDKDGTEKKTCTVCSASKTRKSTANAMANSFYDWALVVIVCNDYGSVNGSTLLSYARCTFDEYIDKAVAADTVFAALSERFAYGITDDAKKQMKDIASWQGSYDAQSDTFTLYMNASDPGEFKLLGYVHNGGNKYTTYYSFTPHDIDTTLNFAVELEYNRANGKPNRYLSVGRADALPGNMISE